MPRGLQVGQTLSPAELESLRWEDFEAKLYHRALRFLSFRPRSGKEIRDYLTKKISSINPPAGGQISKVSEGKIEKIIKRLKESGLVDDRAFARWWKEQRRESRVPRGGRVILQELRAKGVSREILEEVRSSLDEENELELACKAAAKKEKLYATSPPLKYRQKMTAYLLRRGFPFSVIRQVLAERTPPLR